jgi:small subunit ribosomal protein S10
MTEKKKELKFVISGYDVGTTESATKLVCDKVIQLRLKFKGPHPFPTKRIVVSVPSSPHKHKDAQRKYEQLTHRRKIFVTIPDNFSPSLLDSLLSLKFPGKTNLRVALLSP